MHETEFNTLCLGEQGSPLVMLHGWKSDLLALKSLGELLAKHAQVHLIDLPGFGKSSPPPDAWGSKDYANRVLEYLDQKGIQEFSLLGHSFGGRVSLRIAAAYPERVEKLILIGSHGLKRKRSISQELRVLLLPKLGKLVKLVDSTCGTSYFRTKFVPRFASKDYQEAGVLRATMVKLVNEDQSDQLHKIRASSLLLWGELDQETPVEMGRRFDKYIQDSKLIVMDGVGHYPFSDVGAHRCAYYIMKFLGHDFDYSVEPPA